MQTTCRLHIHSCCSRATCLVGAQKACGVHTKVISTACDEAVRAHVVHCQTMDCHLLFAPTSLQVALIRCMLQTLVSNAAECVCMTVQAIEHATM